MEEAHIEGIDAMSIGSDVGISSVLLNDTVVDDGSVRAPPRRAGNVLSPLTMMSQRLTQETISGPQDLARRFRIFEYINLFAAAERHCKVSEIMHGTPSLTEREIVSAVTRIRDGDATELRERTRAELWDHLHEKYSVLIDEGLFAEDGLETLVDDYVGDISDNEFGIYQRLADAIGAPVRLYELEEANLAAKFLPRNGKCIRPAMCISVRWDGEEDDDDLVGGHGDIEENEGERASQPDSVEDADYMEGDGSSRSGDSLSARSDECIPDREEDTGSNGDGDGKGYYLLYPIVSKLLNAFEDIGIAQGGPVDGEFWAQLTRGTPENPFVDVHFEDHNIRVQTREGNLHFSMWQSSQFTATEWAVALNRVRIRLRGSTTNGGRWFNNAFTRHLTRAQLMVELRAAGFFPPQDPRGTNDPRPISVAFAEDGSGEAKQRQSREFLANLRERVGEAVWEDTKYNTDDPGCTDWRAVFDDAPKQQQGLRNMRDAHGDFPVFHTSHASVADGTNAAFNSAYVEHLPAADQWNGGWVAGNWINTITPHQRAQVHNTQGHYAVTPNRMFPDGWKPNPISPHLDPGDYRYPKAWAHIYPVGSVLFHLFHTPARYGWYAAAGAPYRDFDLNMIHPNDARLVQMGIAALPNLGDTLFPMKISAIWKFRFLDEGEGADLGGKLEITKYFEHGDYCVPDTIVIG